MQVRGGFWDSAARAAEADFGLVVSVWSAGCLRTWTVCQECGRTGADAGGLGRASDSGAIPADSPMTASWWTGASITPAVAFRHLRGTYWASDDALRIAPTLGHYP